METVRDQLSPNMTSILIIYSSETGTSEDIAYKLYNLLKSSISIQEDSLSSRTTSMEQRSTLTTIPNVRISSIDDYSIESLPDETCILFIISTTGDGEVPTTMRSFWRFILQKNLPKNSLTKLNYGIFGLGDSGYDKFNAAARKLNSRLKQLGAKEFISIGLGDDQSPLGYLGTLDIWVENLMSLLRLSYVKNSSVQTPPQYFLCYPPTQTSNSHAFLPKPQGGVQLIDIVEAIVTQNVRMSRINWSQYLFHLSLTLPTDPSQQLYRAGDVLVVYPVNPLDIVELALSQYVGKSQFMTSFTPGGGETILEVILDETTEFELNKTQNSFLRKNRLGKMTTTLRQLFSLYLDICGVPQRSFFEQLSFYASDSEEAEKLLELSSGEGVDLYQQYCAKEKRGYIEILSEFKSCNLPLDKLIELIPPLHPRYYSIASDGMVHKNEVQLCVAMVEYTTPLKRKRYGLCSKYLSELIPGCRITCSLRRGTFPLPDSQDPLILIGPGTGLAPMRALIHHRYPQFSHLPAELCLDNPMIASYDFNSSFVNTANSLPTILFYGCRSEDDDYVYKNEWNIISEYAVKNNLSLVIQVAFSRKGTNCGRYVTHDIRDNAMKVWNVIQEPNSRIYVSGSASTKMPSDVRKCLIEVISGAGGMTRENAERYLLKMEKEKRYCVEAWS